ncbi:MAG: type II toxin-antitoxin system RelE/ParE family toxin [Thermodesulfovibrionales bacterium]|nr:type II toxin-antitoxin system RelE/ParE family toxin [Thermodesulfovibrionales bacterium]
MYKIKFSFSALNDIDNIDSSIRGKLINKLKWFQDNFGDIKIMPLKGELSGKFKLKIGDYRVIYEINWDKKEIYILKIGHRRDIYKIDLD